MKCNTCGAPEEQTVTVCRYCKTPYISPKGKTYKIGQADVYIDDRSIEFAVGSLGISKQLLDTERNVMEYKRNYLSNIFER